MIAVVGRLRRYGLWAACAAVSISAAHGAAGAPPDAQRGVAHPALWPRTHSNGLVDASTERRISALLAGMSIEEKVGQMIQADLSTVRPEDLRTYPLGSILVGGNTPPLDAPDRSPMKAWISTQSESRRRPEGR